MNGRAVLACALFCFWMYLAYRSFTGGDTGMAVVFVVVGVALTAYRLRGSLGRR